MKSIVGIGALALGYKAQGAARDPQGKGNTMSEAELEKELRENLAETESKLKIHPDTHRKLKGYLEELHNKTNPSRSRLWLSCQNDRLKHIRWLVDKNDNGRQSGTRLMMRPYDIPWLVWGIGKMAQKEQTETFTGTMTNGVTENVEKILNSPDVKIEFTDKFADFCCLCVSLDTEGCKVHKEFAGYGTTFPQAVQMSDKLRKDSDAILKIIGLQWNDIVTGKKLLELCVNKAPDPSDFAEFPLPRKDWDYYRAGINRSKKNAG